MLVAEAWRDGVLEQVTLRGWWTWCAGRCARVGNDGEGNVDGDGYRDDGGGGGVGNISGQTALIGGRADGVCSGCSSEVVGVEMGGGSSTAIGSEDVSGGWGKLW